MNAARPSWFKSADISILFPGTLDYDSALELQKSERERLLLKKSGGAIIFLEHSPSVITLGRRSRNENLLLSRNELEAMGFQIRETTRGGDVTVHEKGQLMAYFVLPVLSKQAGFFIDSLMNIVTGSIISSWGIEAGFDASRPGIWVRDRKLASIGFDLTAGASMHGMALNVCNTLEGFKVINPCGVPGASMTTLERELGRKIDISEAMEKISEAFM